MRNNYAIILIFISHFILCQTLDSTFGNQGVLTIPNTTNNNRVIISDAYITSDKSILNVGRFSSGNSSLYFVKKYSHLGVLDNSFADNGTFIPLPNPNSWSTDVYLNSFISTDDDSIIISMIDGSLKSWFSKISKFGQLDTTFGIDGYLDYPIKASTKIINRGNHFLSIANYNGNFYINSFNNNGIQNMDFGINGQVISNYGAEYTNINSIKFISKNNKIYIFGYLTYQSNSYSFFSCYKENGQIDSDFGNNGFFILDKYYDNYNGNIDFDIQDDEKILFLAGYSNSDPGQSNPLIIRYNRNGSLDQNFGNLGYANFPISDSWTKIWSNKIIQLPNKKILIGAAVNHYSKDSGPAVLCFNENGSKNLEFGGNITSSYDGQKIYGLYLLPGVYSTVNKIILDPTENSILLTANPYSFLWAYNFKLKYIINNLATIEQDFENDTFKIFPNPAKDFVTVKTNQTENIDFKIFDLSGKLVKAEKTKSNVKIDVQNLQKGNYILRLETEKGQKQIVKLIKN